MFPGTGSHTRAVRQECSVNIAHSESPGAMFVIHSPRSWAFWLSHPWASDAWPSRAAGPQRPSPGKPSTSFRPMSTPQTRRMHSISHFLEKVGRGVSLCIYLEAHRWKIARTLRWQQGGFVVSEIEYSNVQPGPVINLLRSRQERVRAPPHPQARRVNTDGTLPTSILGGGRHPPSLEPQ